MFSLIFVLSTFDLKTTDCDSAFALFQTEFNKVYEDADATALAKNNFCINLAKL